MVHVLDVTDFLFELFILKNLRMILLLGSIRKKLNTCRWLWMILRCCPPKWSSIWPASSKQSVYLLLFSLIYSFNEVLVCLCGWLSVKTESLFVVCLFVCLSVCLAYKVPLQGNYSETLPAQARSKSLERFIKKTRQVPF